MTNLLGHFTNGALQIFEPFKLNYRWFCLQKMSLINYKRYHLQNLHIYELNSDISDKIFSVLDNLCMFS